MQDPRELMQLIEPAGPRDEVAELRTKIEDYERWFRTLDGQICAWSANNGSSRPW